ncbi:MAG: rRNA maturation RNase YbeY [Bacilli bacterium]|nr:rRNA maturation RNase YbeY [Bacilli bacterium]
MDIGVFNETDEDISKYLVDLKELLENICKDEKLDRVIFNVIIIDNERIKEINKIYRGIDKETDVISFALEDDKTMKLDEIRILGDIYISLDKVKSQALEYGHSFKRELSFLAVHGLFHLLGYDHMTKEDEEIMFKKQEEALLKYGIER